MTNETYLVTTDQDREDIAALHWVCFDASEQAGLQVALDDENCFALLGGQDEDGQPTGYCVCRVHQDKSSIGLWYGVRPNRFNRNRYPSRTKGLSRALMADGLTEAQARGAEYVDGYVSSVCRASAIIIRMHKEMGYVLLDSFPNYAIMGGKRFECTTHHFRRYLITWGR